MTYAWAYRELQLLLHIFVLIIRIVTLIQIKGREIMGGPASWSAPGPRAGLIWSSMYATAPNQFSSTGLNIYSTCYLLTTNRSRDSRYQKAHQKWRWPTGPGQCQEPQLFQPLHIHLKCQRWHSRSKSHQKVNETSTSIFVTIPAHQP